MADISKLNVKGNIYNLKDSIAREMIEDMPDPMIFKGSLGTGGTISELPQASNTVIGHTYKVITQGTYAGQDADVGDLFICNDTPEWVLIPSGDEPSGTVTSIATGTGLTGGPITSSGTISVDFTRVQETISDLTAIRAGADAGSTAIQAGDDVSELVNDSGYLTENDFKTINNQSIVGVGNIDISSGTSYTAGDGISIDESSEGTEISNTAGMYLGDDTSPATNYIDADLLGGHPASYYQQALVAGNNITIQNNVISATGGGSDYTIGHGLTLDSEGTLSLNDIYVNMLISTYVNSLNGNGISY